MKKRKTRMRRVVDKKLTIENFIYNSGKRICLIVAVFMFLGFWIGAIKIQAFALEKKESLQRQKGILTYVSSDVMCELEGEQEPFGYAELYWNDKESGKIQELSLIGGTEQYREWKDGFCFPITVTGYDGDIFLLGDVEISGNEELFDYKEEFLKYLGLSEEYYQIDEIQWTGECYEKDGVLCRNALAIGKKLMRYVDARYGGNIRVPERAEEEMLVETAETLKDETVEVKLELEEWKEDEIVSGELELSLFDRLLRWFMEHLTIVSISILFLLGVIFSIIWIFNSKKEESQD